MSATQMETSVAHAETDSAMPPQAPPRRRRRRAPATGAAVDCFACQERQAKCDRKRPYCTACLDLGKDCSGYKTALTWGVGVASRGKLRGLSLPISSSKRAAPAEEDDSSKSESPPKKLTKLGPTRKISQTTDADTLQSKSVSVMEHSTASTPTHYGFVNIDPTSPATAMTSPSYAAPTFEWRRPTSISHTRNVRMVDRKPRRHTLQPLNVGSMHPARDYGVMPMTASIVGGYGHHDFGLSSQISPMVPNFSGYEMTSSVPTPTSAPYDTHLFNSAHLPWADAQMTPSAASDQGSFHGADDIQSYYTGTGSTMDMQQDLMSRNASITSVAADAGFPLEHKLQTARDDIPPLLTDDVGDHAALSLPPSMPSLRIGNTPNLQFLIDYYDQVISPVIVAFDGPTNPYRAHILQLAVESQHLQHAIGALAASNLRIRRSQNQDHSSRYFSEAIESSHDASVRRSSFAHSIMGSSLQCLPQFPSSNEPSTEELFHKAQAIQGLNDQLADPTGRLDDSILASLLILCLYHICDTGVAKFKTQFAGVKKLLALRRGATQSKASNWLTIMFTWFDAMAASVNDRESQFTDDDIHPYSGDNGAGEDGDVWTLENLAGCDTRLFRIISKLGRLNLLSQNRPVSPPPQSPPATAASSNKDYYSIPSTPAYDPTTQFAFTTSNDRTTPNPAFWKEFATIRHALQTWSFPSSLRSSPMDDLNDRVHISESFRYSALLYTERLVTSSTHHQSSPKIQTLIANALHHIQKVKSDVFLLWPLFITGAELGGKGYEGQRAMIRERCWRLGQDSGFWNNEGCLGVLERVWKDDDDNDQARNHDVSGFDTADASDALSGMQSKEAMDPIVATTTAAEWIAGVHDSHDHPVSTSAMSHIPPNAMTARTTGLSPGEYNGTGFRWRKAMERVDGEYIVV